MRLNVYLYYIEENVLFVFVENLRYISVRAVSFQISMLKCFMIIAWQGNAGVGNVMISQ